MRVGGYVRVSQVKGRQGESFLSPTLQADRIRAWCEAGGHELAVLHEDLDVSGGKAERANLTDLVERVEGGELEGIVVARLDRFARSLITGLSLIERIDEAGGRFVSVADGFDTRALTGRLVLRILLSIAQFELERYREQWREAHAKSIERGRHHGPTAPLGYRRREDGVLEPDENAPMVRELFARRAAGEGPTSLARWLAGKGVRTGRDGVPRSTYVVEMLQNRVYLGEVRSGDLRRDGAHKALVDELGFARARAAKGLRPHRSGETAGALSGLVRCHACRHTMGAAQSPYSGGWKRSYRCRSHHGGGECPAPASVIEANLLPIVERQFFTVVGAIEHGGHADDSDAKRLTEERDRARYALDVFRDDPDVIEALGREGYVAGLRSRRAALDEAEQALVAELARRPTVVGDRAALEEDWPNLNVEERRQMLAAVFDAIVVKKPVVHRSHSEPLLGRIGFLLRGTLPGDIPRSGRLPVAVRAFPDLGDELFVAPLDRPPPDVPDDLP